MRILSTLLTALRRWRRRHPRVARDHHTRCVYVCALADAQVRAISMAGPIEQITLLEGPLVNVWVFPGRRKMSVIVQLADGRTWRWPIGDARKALGPACHRPLF